MIQILRSLARFLPILLLSGWVSAARAADPPPNIILIFADDMGYADPGCYGSKTNKTPHLDKLAATGIRFTDFYSAAAVCSSSRAALLTGCYPQRVGIMGALGPQSRVGINASELTVAELCKQKGYATAIFGKWHLGHHPRFLPTRHGFDRYFGLPYSNDMWPMHAANPDMYPPLPMFDQEKIIAYNPDQTQLTRLYTEHAVRFIEENRQKPFFLYVPHSMPHVPLFTSKEFAGKTGAGLYADVIAEIDWSVGQIVQTVEKLGLARNTLIIFTSDNGPWLSYEDHAGSALPLREGKGTTFDGGQREPCIMRWDGVIKPGRVTGELASTMDILPTVARMIGAELPADRVIDGKSILPLLSDETARSPHEVFYFYWLMELQAVRSGPWKLHLPHDYRSRQTEAGRKAKLHQYANEKIGLSLYNLESDIAESNDVAQANPEVVKRLMELAEKARADLGDSGTKVKGAGTRPVGSIGPPPQPQNKTQNKQQPDAQPKPPAKPQT